MNVILSVPEEEQQEEVSVIKRKKKMCCFWTVLFICHCDREYLSILSIKRRILTIYLEMIVFFLSLSKKSWKKSEKIVSDNFEPRRFLLPPTPNRISPKTVSIPFLQLSLTLLRPQPLLPSVLTLTSPPNSRPLTSLVWTSTRTHRILKILSVSFVYLDLSALIQLVYFLGDVESGVFWFGIWSIFQDWFFAAKTSKFR